jgi:hypothetical protein
MHFFEKPMFNAQRYLSPEALAWHPLSGIRS